MVWVPVARPEVLTVATPLPLSATVPSGVLVVVSANATVPVGVPVPEASAEVVTVATPLPFTATVPSGVLVVVSVNTTLPVGVPVPGAVGATLAVNVTDWFGCDGLTEEVSAVVVAAVFTVCVTEP